MKYQTQSQIHKSTYQQQQNESMSHHYNSNSIVLLGLSLIKHPKMWSLNRRSRMFIISMLWVKFLAIVVR